VDDGDDVEESPVRPSTMVADAPDRPPGAHRGRTRWPRRRTVLAGGTAFVVLVAAVVYLVRDNTPVVLLDRPAGPSADWVSGASGHGVTGDEFGNWRGAPVEIAGTWADAEPSLQTKLPTLQRGAEYGNWQKDLDVAIGAIGEGESWADAADGDYDRRWRQSLTNLAELWGDRPGTLYLRFAHEMNGNWYPWAVTADDRDDFMEAWRRFRELQQAVFPESKLVFCLNRESVDSGIDWRETFPGAEYVDVLGVDYYNQNPYAGTLEDFDEAATETDEWGGPKGIAGYQAFAREQGVPLAFPEWNGKASEGDSPAFMYAMYAFFARNGGSGPGQVLYEVLFNMSGYDEDFQLYPETDMSHSAAQYRRLW
jgi:hypothetical protein